MRLIIAIAAISIACNSGADDDLSPNARPVAHVEIAFDGSLGSTVTLDASASTDPDGDPLTYHWFIGRAPNGNASGFKQIQPNNSQDPLSTFVPMQAGVWVVQLQVDDGEWRSEPTFAVLTATDTSDFPIAIFTAPSTGSIGTRIVADGSYSVDPQGGELIYHWGLGYPADGDRPTDYQGWDEAVASFIPASRGTYQLQLTVDNGLRLSAPVSVFIEIDGNTPPVADAGPDQAVPVCREFNLTCAASTDADNDRLYYWWAVQSYPDGATVSSVTVEEPNSADTSVFPEVAGTYSWACSVFDGEEWSSPDSMAVLVQERLDNAAPTVDVGATQIVDGGVVLCDCASPGSGLPDVCTCDRCSPPNLSIEATVADSDGDPMKLQWSNIDGTASLVGATDGTVANVQFGSWRPTEIGTFVERSKLQLRATDCPGATTDALLDIEASCEAVRR